MKLFKQTWFAVLVLILSIISAIVIGQVKHNHELAAMAQTEEVPQPEAEPIPDLEPAPETFEEVPEEIVTFDTSVNEDIEAAKEEISKEIDEAKKEVKEELSEAFKDDDDDDDDDYRYEKEEKKDKKNKGNIFGLSKWKAILIVCIVFLVFRKKKK